MLAILLFSGVWVVVLVAFPAVFQTGLASTAVSVAFGALSLACVVYGERVRQMALLLDSWLLAKLPDASRWKTYAKLVAPIPDLSLLVFLLVGLAGGLATLVLFKVAADFGIAIGSTLNSGGAEKLPPLMISTLVSELTDVLFLSHFLVTLVPTLIMYGVLLQLRGIDVSLFRLFLSIVIPIGLTLLGLVLHIDSETDAKPAEATTISKYFVLIVVVSATLATWLGQRIGTKAFRPRRTGEA